MKEINTALFIKPVFCASSSGLKSTFQLHLHFEWAELRRGGYECTTKENK